MTRLCVAIFVTDLGKAQRDMALAAEAGADLVELRIDQFTDLEQLQLLLKSPIIPCIVTCRPRWEGGHADLEDGPRVAVLEAAANAGAAYIDVELETLHRIGDPARLAAKPLIVSSHDFDGRPDRLNNLIVELNDSAGTVDKIVWTARSIRDNLEVFEILEHQQKPTIALCMGEAGLIGRVLAKKFGAFLTFASLEPGGGTAAGQISVGDMKRLYRWDAIRSETKVYGVVGQPVMHSMSPAIHNAGFEQVGHNGVYLPLLVEGSYESFKAFMESFLNFPSLHLSGLSVTIPHKENALRYLKEKGAVIEPLAERIGAVNTIVIAEAGLVGMNTDYAAILDSITVTLGITREQLAEYRVAVIGAGGTGRTAVAALAHCGATVVVYNRNRERAEALAAEFNGQRGKVVAAAMEKLCDSCCQIYINTTSVGMHPRVDESVWDLTQTKPSADALVFDTVYNPMETKFLKQAREARARTISGVEMFVRQAAAQFEAWTNQPAPVATMRAVIEERLSDQ